MKTDRLHTRTRLQRYLYTRLAKPLFFQQDPEVVHDRVTMLGERLGHQPLGAYVLRHLLSCEDPRLEQYVAGIHFKNPVGLSAGFDKNARLIETMAAVGFGFTEVGSITARPCAGNPKPRLFRLPESQALVVNYGLMNDGAKAISHRLGNGRWPIPVGISLAPTNDEGTKEIPDAIADYRTSMKLFQGIGDYLTLNLSCPNTCSSQPFLEPGNLQQLLTAVTEVECHVPIFLKLSPDVADEQLQELLTVAAKYRVTGVILANLTKKRRKELGGGASGKMVSQQSDHHIAQVYQNWRDRFVIIGCGGIFSAEDAYRKIGLGASLLQMITGMIYQGPQVIGEINQGLVQLLERDGFSSISQARGHLFR
jgi:dihydroorotate dehydrogenase